MGHAELPVIIHRFPKILHKKLKSGNCNSVMGLAILKIANTQSYCAITASVIFFLVQDLNSEIRVKYAEF